MARWTPWVALFLVLAPMVAAQPPTGAPSRPEIERAQQAALRERLMARRPEVPPAPSRDPRLEAAIERLRAAELDRVLGPDWRPPTGRGHRYGQDLADPPIVLSLDADRELLLRGVMSLDEDPGYVWLLGQANGDRRERRGLSRKGPFAIWADPGLPAEVVWTLAWFLQGQSSEVHLIVSRGRVRPETSADPRLRARLADCERELATNANDPICLEQLTEEALEGCPQAFFASIGRDPYDLVLDPTPLFEACGPQPLVDPHRFEAVWRFWLHRRAPIDTEYLIIDTEHPPPRSARTVQQWVRHLMREQLDS